MNVMKSSVVPAPARGDHRLVIESRTRGGGTMRSSITMVGVVSTLLMASACAVQAETGSVSGRSNLTRALQGAWLPLEGGLAVSAREGTPLSAKYEIDDGAFQLSVYT